MKPKIPAGWTIERVPAACYSEDHFSHPFCYPGWEAEVRERGGVVIVPPSYEDGGWVAVVAFPREGR